MRTMMNVLTTFLFAASLAAAGVWSPTPSGEKRKPDEVLVRDGHRVVVVEYDEDGQQNTKVSISSSDENRRRAPAGDSVAAGAAMNVKERIKEAASVLPNLGQGLSYSAPEAQQWASDRARGPKELICDAYGKCKHKIADSLSKSRSKSSVLDKTEDFQETSSRVREGVSSKAQELKRVVSDVAEKAAETAAETAERGQEVAVSTAKTAGNHILSNVSVLMDEAEEAAGRASGSAERVREAVNAVNLAGLAAAFGMSVWISFINSSLLGRAIPRHQFGVVQSKIYPVYFKAMAISIGAALAAHVFGQRKRLSEPAESNQACSLLVSLFMVLFNAYVVEPRATKTMFDRIKIEKEEGRGRGSEESSRTAETLSPAIADASQAQPVIDPAVTAATACASVPTPFPERAEDDRVRARADELNTKLKRFNSCSSLLNLITFLGLTWHLVYLAHHLRRC